MPTDQQADALFNFLADNIAAMTEDDIHEDLYDTDIDVSRIVERIMTALPPRGVVKPAG